MTILNTKPTDPSSFDFSIIFQNFIYIVIKYNLRGDVDNNRFNQHQITDIATATVLTNRLGTIKD